MVKVLRYSLMPTTLKVQQLTARFIAALIFLLVPATLHVPLALAVESSCPGIHVEVLDIRNNNGKVDCALFESPAGFPRQAFRTAKNLMAVKIRDTKAACDFQNIPPGTYALVVIHENANGKRDYDVLGKPKEGLGFSNGAKVSFHAPSFTDASFRYEGGVLNLAVELQY